MKLSQVSGNWRTKILWILKQNKFDNFKIKLVLELNDYEFDRRLQNCELISENTNKN